MPKRYRQLRVKDLPKIPNWRLELESNLLRMQGTDLTTELPRPTACHWFVCQCVCLCAFRCWGNLTPLNTIRRDTYGRSFLGLMRNNGNYFQWKTTKGALSNTYVHVGRRRTRNHQIPLIKLIMLFLIVVVESDMRWRFIETCNIGLYFMIL